MGDVKKLPGLPKKLVSKIEKDILFECICRNPALRTCQGKFSWSAVENIARKTVAVIKLENFYKSHDRYWAQYYNDDDVNEGVHRFLVNTCHHRERKLLLDVVEKTIKHVPGGTLATLLAASATGFLDRALRQSLPPLGVEASTQTESDLPWACLWPQEIADKTKTSESDAYTQTERALPQRFPEGFRIPSGGICDKNKTRESDAPRRNRAARAFYRGSV
jgi:hypothetical protein